VPKHAAVDVCQKWRMTECTGCVFCCSDCLKVAAVCRNMQQLTLIVICILLYFLSEWGDRYIDISNLYYLFDILQLH
jgi:hypothetical protein